MIRKFVQYFKNMLKYIKSGGVVLVNVSFTQPNKHLPVKRFLYQVVQVVLEKIWPRLLWKKELQS